MGRYQRGHVFGQHGAFHVRYYTTEIVDGQSKRVQWSGSQRTQLASAWYLYSRLHAGNATLNTIFEMPFACSNLAGAHPVG